MKITEKINLRKLRGYRQHFSIENFWTKIKKAAAVVGKQGLRQALQLYYVLKKENVPAWAKGVVYGTLGYFIAPLDLSPDIVPVVGFSDDLTVIAAAIGVLAFYIDDDVKQRADNTLKKWFHE